MRIHFTLAIGLIATLTLFARAESDTMKPAESTPSVVRLWEGDAPGALGNKEVDIPTLTIFKPKGPTTAPTAAVVVCPGGGYEHLADHEGKPVAEWLASNGITGIVLKYRISPYRHPVEMNDVQRAMRMVRARATEWNIDAKRVGVLGFSAGGHLASTVTTHFDNGKPDAPDAVDRQSCRPDLSILVYPVISMQEGTTHGGSRHSLLGDSPSKELVDLMSNEMQVTANTPPCFLITSTDDPIVPVENSLLFTMACHKNKVPVELHCIEHGPHGFGLAENDPILHQWTGLCEKWLAFNKFIQK